MSDKPRCHGSVYRPNMPIGRSWGRCSRNGVIERDGKHYCRQHDPEVAAERDRQATERYKKQMAARRIELAGRQLLAACRNGLTELIACRDQLESMGRSPSTDSTAHRANRAINAMIAAIEAAEPRKSTTSPAPETPQS